MKKRMMLEKSGQNFSLRKWSKKQLQTLMANSGDYDDYVNTLHFKLRSMQYSSIFSHIKFNLGMDAKCVT